MDPRHVLALFDHQIRQGCSGEPATSRKALTRPSIRVLDSDAGWATVAWSDLDEATADSAIAEQIRGVYRALVAHRARLAIERGYRYLQVDAMPASEPILRRLGFVRLGTTIPYGYER
jgi:hypothetical protein